MARSKAATPAQRAIWRVWVFGKADLFDWAHTWVRDPKRTAEIGEMVKRWAAEIPGSDLVVDLHLLGDNGQAGPLTFKWEPASMVTNKDSTDLGAPIREAVQAIERRLWPAPPKKRTKTRKK